MMILDSNIIIYSANPELGDLRVFIETNSPAVSEISRVEVLGFADIDQEDEEYFKLFFRAALNIPTTSAIIDIAVNLRRRRRMGLGDALIAATAIDSGRTLVTRNTDDFKWIESLTLLDPLAG